MKTIFVYVSAALMGLGLSWVIGMNGPYWGGVPVTFACAALAFAINWIAFIPSWFSHSEKFYDLTGTITYLSVVICALVLVSEQTIPGFLVAGMVAVWCLRLGIMLFVRVSRAGEDVRFRKIKHDFVSFLGAWTTQGSWVVMTAACALILLTNQGSLSFDIFFVIGSVMWLFGVLFEAVADRQKSQFKTNPENQGKYITTGLWAWSQHPNYFGEILLWTGVAIIALPHLEGWSWFALVSPVFVWFLLTRPMLDNIARKRWGKDAEYLAYTDRTSKLIPMPPKSAGVDPSVQSQ
jgi:steroid 5-alpha reductase family enzyme